MGPNAGADSNNTGGVGYGIVIDKGEASNRVTDNIASGNNTDDLADFNPGCEGNLWFFNSYTSANQSCIE